MLLTSALSPLFSWSVDRMPCDRAMRLGMRSEAHTKDSGLGKGTWFLEDSCMSPRLTPLDFLCEKNKLQSTFFALGVFVLSAKRIHNRHSG